MFSNTKPFRIKPLQFLLNVTVIYLELYAKYDIYSAGLLCFIYLCYMNDDLSQ